ncbi:MAG TPA: twin-arginine translocation signal domain-containing protein [Candidatus Saccharimonadales bacterium]|nr:twin-arginine translocation signal domain-containing protein [Candidatus Saccharimonadales bacterium]
MSKEFSRRDFLKIAGAAVGALALKGETPKAIEAAAANGRWENESFSGISVENSTLTTTFDEIPFDEPNFIGLEVVDCTKYSAYGEECLKAPERKIIADHIIFDDLPLNIALPIVAKDLGENKFSLWVRGDLHQVDKDKCIVATVMTMEKWQNVTYQDNRRIYVATKDGQWYMRVTRK